jgi:hypothetical protein
MQREIIYLVEYDPTPLFPDIYKKYKMFFKKSAAMNFIVKKGFKGLQFRIVQYRKDRMK